MSIGSSGSVLTMHASRITKVASKGIMRSYKFQLPVYDFPIRLRPWFIIFTSIIMVILAFLGFTNFARSLPLNDKILHFICLAFATGVFYFIFDVEEEARRVLFWRHSPLIITGVICFFFGGIISELIQSLLPYKEFQMGDVIANLLGSALGLFIAYYLERYYRHRREISRLYRPVSLDPNDISDSDDEDGVGTTLLPLYRSRQPTETDNGNSKGKAAEPLRLNNVWDEREEVFGIGDSDDEQDQSPSLSHSQKRPPLVGPKIIITDS